ncbi:hypothetical protein OSH40_26450, partial [Mycobacterium ulcerans]
PHLRGFVMAAQPRQSWSSCDLSGPDTPGPIRPLTPLPRQSPALSGAYRDVGADCAVSAQSVDDWPNRAQKESENGHFP